MSEEDLILRKEGKIVDTIPKKEKPLPKKRFRVLPKPAVTSDQVRKIINAVEEIPPEWHPDNPQEGLAGLVDEIAEPAINKARKRLERLAKIRNPKIK